MPTPTSIKRQIESLIERLYIARDETDSRIYRFVSFLFYAESLFLSHCFNDSY